MRSLPPLELREEERSELERRASSKELPRRVVQRARAVLLAAEGLSNREIGSQLGMHYNRVAVWRRRYDELGLAGLDDDERPGRPPLYGPQVVLRLLELLGGPGRWTGESLAGRLAAEGVPISSSQVRRLCASVEAGPRFSGHVPPSARPIPVGCTIDLLGLELGRASSAALVAVVEATPSLETSTTWLEEPFAAIARAEGARSLASALRGRAASAGGEAAARLSTRVAELLDLLPEAVSLSCLAEGMGEAEVEALRALEGRRFHLHLGERRGTFANRLELLLALLEQQAVACDPGSSGLARALTECAHAAHRSRAFAWTRPAITAPPASLDSTASSRSLAPGASANKQPSASSGDGPNLVVLAAGQARRFGGCKPLAPVGPHGEAIIDYVASDALLAGYRRIVLVVNPETGPAIREHVLEHWPSALSVSFAEQQRPLGTVDSVLAARRHLDAETPFAVANGDDVYGVDAMRLLAAHLAGRRHHPVPHEARNEADHAMVAFRLISTLVLGSRVNRGICRLDRGGYLARLDERRAIGFEVETPQITSRDGNEPVLVDPGAVTSMNLWGFQSSIWPVLDEAMAEWHRRAALAEDGARRELLIPEVVDRSLRSERLGARVRAIVSQGECLGVTHPGDLPAVQAGLVRQMARGARRSELWIVENLVENLLETAV